MQSITNGTRKSSNSVEIKQHTLEKQQIKEKIKREVNNILRQENTTKTYAAKGIVREELIIININFKKEDLNVTTHLNELEKEQTKHKVEGRKQRLA